MLQKNREFICAHHLRMLVSFTQWIDHVSCGKTECSMCDKSAEQMVLHVIESSEN